MSGWGDGRVVTKDQIAITGHKVMCEATKQRTSIEITETCQPVHTTRPKLSHPRIHLYFSVRAGQWVL